MWPNFVVKNMKKYFGTEFLSFSVFHYKREVSLGRSFPVRVRIHYRINSSFGKPRLFTLTGTLHWADKQRVTTGLSLNLKFMNCSLFVNKCHLLFCTSPRCTFVHIISALPATSTSTQFSQHQISNSWESYKINNSVLSVILAIFLKIRDE